MAIVDVSTVQTANNLSDFNELEYKKFAMRTGDRWSFFISMDEIQNMDRLMPDHVLIVENSPVAIGCEIMSGKLVKKIC